jgi:phage shock protein A
MLLVAALIFLLLGVIYMLAEVQSLKDQVAVSVAAEAAAIAKVGALTTQVTDLTAQLAAAVASAITAEDKAAIVQATTDLKTSSDALTPVVA